MPVPSSVVPDSGVGRKSPGVALCILERAITRRADCASDLVIQQYDGHVPAVTGNSITNCHSSVVQLDLLLPISRFAVVRGWMHLTTLTLAASVDLGCSPVNACICAAQLASRCYRATIARASCALLCVHCANSPVASHALSTRTDADWHTRRHVGV